MTYRIATWNVNSVRLRLPIFDEWLKSADISILLLQEIKCIDQDFPKYFFEERGYNVSVCGQKTFNGVAILSKFPIEDVSVSLPGFAPNPFQARYIEAFTGGFRVMSVYVPNGQEIDSPAYHHKLQFLQALHDRLRAVREWREDVVVGGDYNIAPQDQDVYASYKSSLFVSEKERQAFQKILNLGYQDAYSIANEQPEFTWWDYRGGSFTKNLGMRIDHLLISPKVVDRMSTVFTVKDLRYKERPSDHIPVIIEVAK